MTSWKRYREKEDLQKAGVWNKTGIVGTQEGVCKKKYMKIAQFWRNTHGMGGRNTLEEVLPHQKRGSEETPYGKQIKEEQNRLFQVRIRVP